MTINKVALLGMMASGKTTIGRPLAGRLGAVFRDADHEIENRAGMAIADCFARRGEAAFRRLERDAIRDLLARPGPLVLALGGGAYMQPEVREALRDGAVTVYLRVAAAEIVRRLEGTDIAARPVLASAPDWRRRAEELVAERGGVYAGADVVFDADGRDIDNMVDRLAEILAGRIGLKHFH